MFKWRRILQKYRNPALLDRKSGVTTGYPALRLDAVRQALANKVDPNQTPQKVNTDTHPAVFGHTIIKLYHSLVRVNRRKTDNIFYYFSQKTSLDITNILSVKTYFLGKIEKNISNCLLKLLFRPVCLSEYWGKYDRLLNSIYCTDGRLAPVSSD